MAPSLIVVASRRRRAAAPASFVVVVYVVAVTSCTQQQCVLSRLGVRGVSSTRGMQAAGRPAAACAATWLRVPRIHRTGGLLRTWTWPRIVVVVATVCVAVNAGELRAPASSVGIDERSGVDVYDATKPFLNSPLFARRGSSRARARVFGGEGVRERAGVRVY